jgi:flagellar protein FlaF
MSLGAYQKTQKITENPRETEYRLFGQVTHALIGVKSLEPSDKRVIDALDWNRRMWGVLSTDCGSDGNGLAIPLRAQIISLSIWVSKYSSEVMRGKADVEPLIDINTTIMEGLRAVVDARS